MSLTEINFDGIIGPSHNYAGLSLGNLAANLRTLGKLDESERLQRQALAIRDADVCVGGGGHFLHRTDFGIRMRDAGDLGIGKRHGRRRGGKFQHGPW